MGSIDRYARRRGFANLTKALAELIRADSQGDALKSVGANE